MSQLNNVFPGFKQTSPTRQIKEGVEFESFAKVEPDLWEIKRSFDNGYERAAVFHRGELFHYQYNHYQSGVKNMPLSAIITAQGYVIAAGKDAQTTRNDLEGLNVLARKVIAKLEMDDQGRAEGWAERHFEDPLEAADELYHTCMGWLGHELNGWQDTHGIKISQRVLWGVQKVAFTFTCTHNDDKVEFNRTFDFLTEFFPQAKAALDEITVTLLTMGWISAQPPAVDVERLRKERILRNSQAALGDTSKVSEHAGLPPAMRELAENTDK